MAAKLRAREVGCLELLEHHVARVERFNPDLNAIVVLDLDRARERAGAADAALARGEFWGPLHGLPMTGLRFFTVYGPWGRPDMAAYIFTRAIFEGRPIKLFNAGRMRRDFTYIDDIVDGCLAAIKRPPRGPEASHRLYHLGNHRSEPLRSTRCG